MADLNLSVAFNPVDLQNAINSVINRQYNIRGINTSSIRRPLGSITAAASEFEKSMEAANARVLAFGATAGSIYVVKKAFDLLVSSTVDVERQMVEINSILGLTSKQLGQFSSDIFSAANSVSVSFADASKAALEFARQGLSVEETLRRTRDSLILARVAGMDFSDSAMAITAALNSFSNEVIRSTDLVDRLTNADANFAVSAGDLAEAIKRVGSSAADANVSLNETIALVTAAQQTTSRGGAVIGNSFKTIFTRLSRGSVLNDLEALGISTKNAAGDTLPLIQVLKNLSSVYESLGSSQKSFVAELVGGVYQINILKATLGDLGKSGSVFNSVLRTVENSTGSAERRIDQLNQSLSARLNVTLNRTIELAAAIGNKTIAPVFKGVLGDVNNTLRTVSESVSGEDIGSKIADGMLGGIKGFLQGPGAAMIGFFATKLAGNFGGFVKDSLSSFGGVNSAAQQQALIQSQILGYLRSNPQVLETISSATGTVSQRATVIANAHYQTVTHLRQQNALMNAQNSISQQMAQRAYAGGARVVPARTTPITPAAGFIPNFNSQEAGQMMENAGARQHGYSAGTAYRTTVHDGNGNAIPTFVNSRERVETFTNSEGNKATMVTPPNGFGEGTMYGARGFVPNFNSRRRIKVWRGEEGGNRHIERSRDYTWFSEDKSHGDLYDKNQQAKRFFLYTKKPLDYRNKKEFERNALDFGVEMHRQTGSSYKGGAKYYSDIVLSGSLPLYGSFDGKKSKTLEHDFFDFAKKRGYDAVHRFDSFDNGPVWASLKKNYVQAHSGFVPNFASLADYFASKKRDPLLPVGNAFYNGAFKFGVTPEEIRLHKKDPNWRPGKNSPQLEPGYVPSRKGNVDVTKIPGIENLKIGSYKESSGAMDRILALDNSPENVTKKNAIRLAQEHEVEKQLRSKLIKLGHTGITIQKTSELKGEDIKGVQGTASNYPTDLYSHSVDKSGKPHLIRGQVKHVKGLEGLDFDRILKSFEQTKGIEYDKKQGKKYGSNIENVLFLEEKLIEKGINDKKGRKNISELMKRNRRKGLSGGFIPNFNPNSNANSIKGRNTFQTKWMMEKMKKDKMDESHPDFMKYFGKMAVEFGKPNKYPSNQLMFGLSGGFVPNFAKNIFISSSAGNALISTYGKTAEILGMETNKEGSGGSKKIYRKIFEEAKRKKIKTVIGKLQRQDREAKDDSDVSAVKAMLPQVTRARFGKYSILGVGNTEVKLRAKTFDADLAKNAALIRRQMNTGDLPFLSTYLNKGFVPNFAPRDVSTPESLSSLGFSYLGSGAESNAFRRGGLVVKRPTSGNEIDGTEKHAKKVAISLRANEIFQTLGIPLAAARVREGTVGGVKSLLQRYSGRTLGALVDEMPKEHHLVAEQILQFIKAKQKSFINSPDGFDKYRKLGGGVYMGIDTGSDHNFTVGDEKAFKKAVVGRKPIPQIMRAGKMRAIDLAGYSKGFVPNFNAIDRSMKEERSHGKGAKLNYDPEIGPFVSQPGQGSTLAEVMRYHPEGLSAAISNSKKSQGLSGGFIPNFAEDDSSSGFLTLSSALMGSVAAMRQTAAISKQNTISLQANSDALRASGNNQRIGNALTSLNSQEINRFLANGSTDGLSKNAQRALKVSNPTDLRSLANTKAKQDSLSKTTDMSGSTIMASSMLSMVPAGIAGSMSDGPAKAGAESFGQAASFAGSALMAFPGHIGGTIAALSILIGGLRAVYLANQSLAQVAIMAAQTMKTQQKNFETGGQQVIKAYQVYQDAIYNSAIPATQIARLSQEVAVAMEKIPQSLRADFQSRMRLAASQEERASIFNEMNSGMIKNQEATENLANSQKTSESFSQYFKNAFTGRENRYNTSMMFGPNDQDKARQRVNVDRDVLSLTSAATSTEDKRKKYEALVDPSKSAKSVNDFKTQLAAIAPPEAKAIIMGLNKEEAQLYQLRMRQTEAARKQSEMMSEVSKKYTEAERSRKRVAQDEVNFLRERAGASKKLADSFSSLGVISANTVKSGKIDAQSKSFSSAANTEKKFVGAQTQAVIDARTSRVSSDASTMQNLMTQNSKSFEDALGRGEGFGRKEGAPGGLSVKESQANLAVSEALGKVDTTTGSPQEILDRVKAEALRSPGGSNAKDISKRLEDPVLRGELAKNTAIAAASLKVNEAQEQEQVKAGIIAARTEQGIKAFGGIENFLSKQKTKDDGKDFRKALRLAGSGNADRAGRGAMQLILSAQKDLGGSLSEKSAGGLKESAIEARARQIRIEATKRINSINKSNLSQGQKQSLIGAYQEARGNSRNIARQQVEDAAKLERAPLEQLNRLDTISKSLTDLNKSLTSSGIVIKSIGPDFFYKNEAMARGSSEKDDQKAQDNTKKEIARESRRSSVTLAGEEMMKNDGNFKKKAIAINAGTQTEEQKTELFKNLIRDSLLKKMRNKDILPGSGVEIDEFAKDMSRGRSAYDPRKNANAKSADLMLEKLYGTINTNAGAWENVNTAMKKFADDLIPLTGKFSLISIVHQVLRGGMPNLSAPSLPNFSAKSDAFRRESQALTSRGINPTGQIYFQKHASLPNGGVANYIDEPRGIAQGIARARKEGKNPLTYGMTARTDHRRRNSSSYPNFAKPVTYLFVPEDLDKDPKSSAIDRASGEKAGYRIISQEDRARILSGEMKLPKGAKVIDSTGGHFVTGYQDDKSGNQLRMPTKVSKGLDVTGTKDPGMDKLQEARAGRLSQSGGIDEFLKEQGVKLGRSKVDLKKYEAQLVEKYGKDFFLKPKGGARGIGVFSHTSQGGNVKSFRAEQQVLVDPSEYMVQRSLRNISGTEFRVTAMGDEKGSKILEKSQYKSSKKSMGGAFWEQRDSAGAVIKDPLMRGLNQKKHGLLTRMSLGMSRGIAEAQAQRAISYLPKQTRSGALYGMDVAETGHTGIMKALQYTAEKTGIGHKLFKGGGVIEFNASDRTGFSGAVQRPSLAIKVAQELDGMKKIKSAQKDKGNPTSAKPPSTESLHKREDIIKVAAKLESAAAKSQEAYAAKMFAIESSASGKSNRKQENELRRTNNSAVKNQDMANQLRQLISSDRAGSIRLSSDFAAKAGLLSPPKGKESSSSAAPPVERRLNIGKRNEATGLLELPVNRREKGARRKARATAKAAEVATNQQKSKTAEATKLLKDKVAAAAAAAKATTPQPLAKPVSERGRGFPPDEVPKVINQPTGKVAKAAAAAAAKATAEAATQQATPPAKSPSKGMFDGKTRTRVKEAWENTPEIRNEIATQKRQLRLYATDAETAESLRIRSEERKLWRSGRGSEENNARRIVLKEQLDAIHQKILPRILNGGMPPLRNGRVQYNYVKPQGIQNKLSNWAASSLTQPTTQPATQPATQATTQPAKQATTPQPRQLSTNPRNVARRAARAALATQAAPPTSILNTPISGILNRPIESGLNNTRVGQRVNRLDPTGSKVAGVSKGLGVLGIGLSAKNTFDAFKQYQKSGDIKDLNAAALNTGFTLSALAGMAPEKLKKFSRIGGALAAYTTLPAVYSDVQNKDYLNAITRTGGTALAFVKGNPVGFLGSMAIGAAQGYSDEIRDLNKDSKLTEQETAVMAGNLKISEGERFAEKMGKDRQGNAVPLIEEKRSLIKEMQARQGYNVVKVDESLGLFGLGKDKVTEEYNTAEVAASNLVDRDMKDKNFLGGSPEQTKLIKETMLKKRNEENAARIQEIKDRLKEISEEAPSLPQEGSPQVETEVKRPATPQEALAAIGQKQRITPQLKAAMEKNMAEGIYRPEDYIQLATTGKMNYQREKAGSDYFATKNKIKSSSNAMKFWEKQADYDNPDTSNYEAAKTKMEGLQSQLKSPRDVSYEDENSPIQRAISAIGRKQTMTPQLEASMKRSIKEGFYTAEDYVNFSQTGKMDPQKTAVALSYRETLKKIKSSEGRVKYYEERNDIPGYHSEAETLKKLRGELRSPGAPVNVPNLAASRSTQTNSGGGDFAEAGREERFSGSTQFTVNVDQGNKEPKTASINMNDKEFADFQNKMLAQIIIYNSKFDQTDNDIRSINGKATVPVAAAKATA